MGSASTLAAIAVVALSACGVGAKHARDPEAEYLALRAEYASALAARYNRESDATMPADSLALVDLERHLRPVIGHFAIKGIADTGRINLATLLPGDEDSDLADGLLYQTSPDSTHAFVTTPGLFRAWIASRFATDSTVPRDPTAALTRPEIYNAIIDEDAAVYRYADLPVTAPQKRVLAAMLVNRAQDYCFECVPRTLLLGVSTGNHIVVIESLARDSISIPAQCRDSADGNSRSEDARFASLQQCYGRAIRTDPAFPRIVAEARELLDDIPDR